MRIRDKLTSYNNTCVPIEENDKVVGYILFDNKTRSGRWNIQTFSYEYTKIYVRLLNEGAYAVKDTFSCHGHHDLYNYERTKVEIPESRSFISYKSDYIEVDPKYVKRCLQRIKEYLKEEEESKTERNFRERIQMFSNYNFTGCHRYVNDSEKEWREKKNKEAKWSDQQQKLSYCTNNRCKKQGMQHDGECIQKRIWEL